MPTLLTSDELDIRILFTESAPDVLTFVREAIRGHEPIGLSTNADHHVYLVNLANLKQFALTELDRDDESLADDQITVLTSLAELRDQAG
ncbi:hypothetical protein [Gordonia sp. SL306]|uniref:hypothetical protein n=1 Tax=Gordonia sp. SL306 TaxID=2995145 RepID=UPI0013BA05EB|nr:hypothetical protein [Gordonia sp. SL306]NDZ97722.1 hypothetical protein [Streptomyces sp. SID11726]NEB26807.1 hypothetical protein [Streptomyces sp. SID6673]WAC57369.1 hypothetical protein OVA31_09100 [Gordonia sp. SL306]